MSIEPAISGRVQSAPDHVRPDWPVDCVLDGEVVAGAGLPSDFYGLAGAVSSRWHRRPLTFVAFDVLALQGRSVTGYGYAERRQMLETVVRISDGALVAVNTFNGSDVDDVLACCDELRMEGVVVKRRWAPYRPGKRSADWRNVKTEGWCSEHADRRVKK